MSPERSRDSAAPPRPGGDDPLQAAIEGLRDTEPASPRLARATRARVLSELHAQRRRRSSRLAVLVPLAAILVGSTAWAGATGRLQQMLHLVVEAVASDEPAAGSPTPAGPPAARDAAEAPEQLRRSTADEAEGESPAPEAADEPPARVRAGQQEAASDAAGGRAAAAPPSTSSAADDAELAAYRAAHQLHFGGGDGAETLAAWDSYLRRWPAGRFALEGRYNRAVCLVRMGRSAAAVQALRPFAEGRHGEYRQAEAQRLIDALQRKSD